MVEAPQAVQGLGVVKHRLKDTCPGLPDLFRRCPNSTNCCRPVLGTTACLLFGRATHASPRLDEDKAQTHLAERGIYGMDFYAFTRLGQAAASRDLGACERLVATDTCMRMPSAHAHARRTCWSHIHVGKPFGGPRDWDKNKRPPPTPTNLPWMLPGSMAEQISIHRSQLVFEFPSSVPPTYVNRHRAERLQHMRDTHEGTEDVSS